jgi:hypothetical protein
LDAAGQKRLQDKVGKRLIEKKETAKNISYT